MALTARRCLALQLQLMPKSSQVPRRRATPIFAYLNRRLTGTVRQSVVAAVTSAPTVVRSRADDQVRKHEALLLQAQADKRISFGAHLIQATPFYGTRDRRSERMALPGFRASACPRRSGSTSTLTPALSTE